jgi:hypothetical protein
MLDFYGTMYLFKGFAVQLGFGLRYLILLRVYTPSRGNTGLCGDGQFDPVVVNVFLSTEIVFRQIRSKLTDNELSNQARVTEPLEI